MLSRAPGSHEVAASTAVPLVESPLPPLEEEIDELEELHELRARAYELRDRGKKALRERLADAETGISWAPRGNEPDDYIERSVILLALSKGKVDAILQLEAEANSAPDAGNPIRRLVDELNAVQLDEILQFDAVELRDVSKPAQAELLSLHRRQFTRSQLLQLVRDLKANKPHDARPSIDGYDARDRSFRELESLLQPKAPILQATRTLQALLTIPGQGLGRGALLCYGTIIHELYTAAPPDRTVGSARTRPGGHHTAFMTSECTRAVAGFARMLDRSGDVLDALCGLHSELAALRENVLLPPEWVAHERRRACLEFTNRLNRAWVESAFPLRTWTPGDRAKCTPIPALLDHAGGATEERLAEFFRFALGAIRETLLQATVSSNDALVLFEKREQVSRSSADRLDGAIAQEAIRSMKALARQLKECRDRHEAALAGYVDGSGGIPTAELMRLHVHALALSARRGADEVRSRLGPASHYLESVLDREITSAFSASRGVWNPADLACAAAAYGSLNKHRKSSDYRLEAARDLLDGALATDGSFPTQLALELEDSGYTLTLVWSEAIKAFAQVLQIVERPIRATLVRRLLVKFEKTAVPAKGSFRQSGSEDGVSSPGIAWTHDQPRYPTWAYRWTSALAILALDRIGRMLDVRINARVQRHFSCRASGQIASALRIENLFYPDYGLSTAGPKIDLGSTTGRRQPVAAVLESMRAHVMGLPIAPGMVPSSVSAVFYGPPGTGKTTLMEALAGSAGVLFVEVTPSDLARAGEQWMERRSRAVFKALSFLSHAVVCFDEFEPIIRRRAQDPSGTSASVLEWLTSSMLPKLKLLRERAERQSMVFSLQTNHIGAIDEAAVRRGRFDHRIGVYPPDVVSRLGRLMAVLAVYKVTLSAEAKHRALDVVGRTAGGAMTTLARRGVYSPPQIEGGRVPSPKSGTVHAYILGGNSGEAPNLGTPEADFERLCPKLKEIALCKRLADSRVEWRTIHAWDKAFADSLTTSDPANVWASAFAMLGRRKLADEAERESLLIASEDKQAGAIRAE